MHTNTVVQCTRTVLSTVPAHSTVFNTTDTTVLVLDPSIRIVSTVQYSIIQVNTVHGIPLFYLQYLSSVPHVPTTCTVLVVLNNLLFIQ